MNKVKQWYNRRWLSKKKQKLAYLTLAGIVIMTLYVLLTVTGIYPPEQENTVPLKMTIWWGPMTIEPDIEITVSTKSIGPLVVGQKATISGIGYIRNQSLLGITKVDFGFRNSFAYPPENNDRGFSVDYNATLYNDGTGKLTGTSVTIYFPTAGSYNPVFQFWTANMTYPIEYQYSTITVSPATELTAERTNNVNSALSIALFYFGLIEAVSLSTKLVKRVSSKKIQGQTKQSHNATSKPH